MKWNRDVHAIRDGSGATEMVEDDRSAADAEFIVRACNSHEGLLTLARSFRHACEERIAALPEKQEDWEFHDDNDDINRQIGHWSVLLEECDVAIRAATP